METLRYPTLKAWAEDICNAVREKDGTADPIDHQDAPDRIRAIPTGSNIDLSGITAQQADVSERVQYIDSAGELKYGTMPEITAETKTLDGDNTEYIVEEGHHSGSGKVRIVPETLYAAPSRSTQELESPVGKVYTKVVLDPIPDIYKDVSAADAVPGAVLNGYTFYGKAGNLETGNIVTKNGKQGATVSANGNRYIPVGYHDGTTYITVNVPQEIVTVQGEDSTNCNAISANVRRYNDAGKQVTFRAGGKLSYGAMPDVALPNPTVTVDKDYSTAQIKITSQATVSKAGYIQEGDINGYAFLPKYTDAYTVNPGEDRVTLNTSGKYMTGNIVVEAAAKTHGSGSALVSTRENTFTISGVKKQPDILFVSLNIAMADDVYLIHEIYHSFLSGDTIASWKERYYTSSGNPVDTLYRGKNYKDFSVSYSNNTITVSSGDYYFFKGTYNWMWG